VELQLRIAEDALPRGVGIGLDAGEAVALGRGYRGAALNRAARLCAIARPGQVLASEGVVHLAGQADGVAYGLRRRERLKGFDRPVTVIEIHPETRRPGRELARRILRLVKGTRPRLRAAVAGAVVASVALVAIVLAVTSKPAKSLAANSLGAFDVGSGKLAATLNPRSQVAALVADKNAFWAFDPAGFMQRIDVKTRSVTTQFPLGVDPAWIAPRVAFGAIWTTDPHSPAVHRYDIRYRRARQTIQLPPSPRQGEGPANSQGLAIGEDAIWVVYGFPKRIAKIDPETNDVVFHRDLPNGAYYDGLVAAGDRQVWVVDRSGHQFVRIDPKNGDVLYRGRLHDGWVEDAAVLGGYLWLPMEGDSGVWKIDRTASVVGKIPTGDLPFVLAQGDGALWDANSKSGTVTRIDPDSGATRQYRTGHRPTALTVVGDRAWVYVDPSGADARAGLEGKKVVNAVAEGDPYWITDPSTYGGETAQLALAYSTGARLMDYRPDANGTARVVPDVAAGPPAVSNGRRTYTFRIRSGFRFSPPSGQHVTARAFKFTLERALSPKLANPYCRVALLSDIVGEDAYVAGKADHISGIVARGNRLSITLVEPSGTLPARLAATCLSAVPPGTPVLADGLEQPIPSAGPYYISSHLPNEQLILRRNPNYGGDRPQRIDAVVVREGVASERAGVLVAADKADYVFDRKTPASAAFAADGRYERLYGPGSR
jgi:streptogramin lyase